MGRNKKSFEKIQVKIVGSSHGCEHHGFPSHLRILLGNEKFSKFLKPEKKHIVARGGWTLEENVQRVKNLLDR